MPGEGWFDDGSGRERWWDGTQWTDRFRDAEPAQAAPAAGFAPLRVFAGNGTGGSASLAVFPTFVEFEHKNYVVTVPKPKVGPISYSKQQRAPYDSVAITPDIDFHCVNPREVYEYLRGWLAAP